MALLFGNDADLNGHKIVNLEDGSSADDAVNKSQLDANASADRARGNHTGTQTASTISNFTAAVQALAWASMVAPSGAVNINSQKLENVADGSTSTDAVNKGQLDAAVAGIASGLAFKGVVEVTHSSNVTLSNPGTSTFDGQTITSGQIVLLTGQSTGSQNGPYTFNGSSSAMTRATNWDTTGEAVVGSFWVVKRGTNADLFALMTNDSFTLGTDTAAFLIRGGAGASDDDASYAANVGTGSAGPYSVTHSLGSTDVNVTVRELSGGYVKLVAWKPTDTNTVSLEPDETWSTNSHRVYVSRIA